jgi:predicted XRE-type DNA-binding protein
MPGNVSSNMTTLTIAGQGKAMKKIKVSASNITLGSMRSSQKGLKQAVVAMQMQLQEPAVSKIERKQLSDNSLNKIMRYIEALGGQVNLMITLPDGNEIHIGNN